MDAGPNCVSAHAKAFVCKKVHNYSSAVVCPDFTLIKGYVYELAAQLRVWTGTKIPHSRNVMLNDPSGAWENKAMGEGSFTQRQNMEWGLLG